MELIKFVANYDDLSTDRGYQFKFHCDKCGNGHMSEFQSSLTGMAGGLLRAAGSIFGGILGSAGQSAYEIQRTVGGKEHDDALRKAVEAAKGYFKQCSRCGKWVCPDVCWNAKKALCEYCAPDEQEEIAAAQAEIFKEQVFDKARAANLVKDVDIEQKATVECGKCGAKAQGGKFCPECGAPFRSTVKCGRCGTEADAGTKFCPECGQKLQAPA